MTLAAVIVLAAGEGTRMKSRLPKVLHQIGGRSLLGHAVRVAETLAPEHLAVVVGHERAQVIEHLEQIAPTALPVVQEDREAAGGRYGTGYATRVALDALPALSGSVLVTTADVPLLSSETLRALVATHESNASAATVLSAEVPDPSGYGRITRATDGSVTGIVEHKDATAEQLAIAEINSGIIAFDAAALADALTRVKTDNSQGEEYLTDVLGILRDDGQQVGAVVASDWTEILGVNDRVQLADLGCRLNDRTLRQWMLAGVTVVDPATTWVDDTVTLAPDVTVWPQTHLSGTTVVESGARIGPDTSLRDCRVAAEATVVRAHGERAEIGAGAEVGPYAYLRPGTRLGAHGKIGTFVETKQAQIGDRTKVPHLSYVGDATLGEDANIGAGTIFANYDGVHKHHTEVGDAVFVGSDSVLVAPARLEDGSYVAAGSTVTKPVASGELAVARGQQRNIAGWVERKRSGTVSAEAAGRARSSVTGDTGDSEAEPHEETDL